MPLKYDTIQTAALPDDTWRCLCIPDHFASFVPASPPVFQPVNCLEGRNEPVIGLKRHPLIIRFSPGNCPGLTSLSRRRTSTSSSRRTEMQPLSLSIWLLIATMIQRLSSKVNPLFCQIRNRSLPMKIIYPFISLVF